MKKSAGIIFVRKTQTENCRYFSPPSEDGGGTNPVTHSQEEIDLVANDGKDYIFGECKWRNDKTDLSVLCELKAKADIFSKNKNNTYYALFSKSGFTDAVINEAKSDSSIILADLNEIMNF